VSVKPWVDTRGRNRWKVEFETSGNRVFRRLPPSATKGQATQLEARLRNELIDQVVLGKRPNVTLRYAIESWLEEVVKGRKSEDQTRSHAATVLGLVARDNPDCPVQDTGSLVGAIREDGRLSPATRNRRLCVLKAVAKFAWRKGWTEENLSGKIQLLPEPKYTRRDVTPADARLLIEKASSPRAKALIALSAFTGMRLGEVLKLKPSDIHDGVIVARDTKNGSDRIIPILAELRPHLGQIPFRAGWRNVYRGFERAREAAGLSLRYHDLRHMVASALARSDADLRVSMDLMGHKSVETHRRYVHTDVAAKRQALTTALAHQDPIRKRAKAKKAA
jgi:integrase